MMALDETPLASVEVLARAKCLRIAAVASRENYPESFQPDPDWDQLDQFNKDAWLRLARQLIAVDGGL